MKKKRLVTRLRNARKLVRVWKVALYEGEKSRAPGPEYGTVDEAMARELELFDDAYAALTEAIKLAVDQEPGAA